MKYKRIAGINKDWSLITMGCWQLAPDGFWQACTPQDADAVIKEALNQGISAFDTAEGYGNGESERRLSKALGSKKDDVIIISKILPDADLSLKSYQEHLDSTLQALNRDFVDLYLIHWPDEKFNTEEKSQKLAHIMQSLKESGKVHAIGLSNFHQVDLERLGHNLREFIINEVPYSLLDRRYEENTREICISNHIPYMAYSPTAKGFLARRLNEEERNLPARLHDDYYSKDIYPEAIKVFETVQAIATQLGVKPIEIALAWVLAQPNIHTAIVGSRKPHQVPEFAKAASITLSEEHLSQLTRVSVFFASDSFQKVRPLKR